MGDDTASVAVLLMTAKYFVQHQILPQGGLLFVCNSCEEGLVNLKGTRPLMQNYAGKVRSPKDRRVASPVLLQKFL